MIMEQIDTIEDFQSKNEQIEEMTKKKDAKIRQKVQHGRSHGSARVKKIMQKNFNKQLRAALYQWRDGNQHVTDL